MRRPIRFVVFDALLFRALVINSRRAFSDELEAFTVAFRARRFRVIITDRILKELETEARNGPPFQVQPLLDELLRGRRAIYFEERQLIRALTETTQLPREHRALVEDALGAGASYLITYRRRWLDLSEQMNDRYGLQIVTPGRFVELEGS